MTSVRLKDTTDVVRRPAWVGATEPTSDDTVTVGPGTLWIDDSTTPNVLKRRNDADDGWVAVGLVTGTTATTAAAGNHNHTHDSLTGRTTDNHHAKAHNVGDAATHPDVLVTSPATGDALVYDATAVKWKNVPVSGGVTLSSANPTTAAPSATADPGTGLSAAHGDHRHGMPATWPPGSHVHSAHSGLGADDHGQYQLRSERGSASGYAPLDSGFLVPVANLGTGTPTGSKFLRDDRTWAVPAGGGGGSLTIEELDGTPSVVATKLILPSGTVSVTGTEATYTPAGGSGGALSYIGKTTIGTSTQVATSNRCYAKKITPSADCVVMQVEASVAGDGAFVGAIEFAVYDHDAVNNKPGSVLQYSRVEGDTLYLTTTRRWIGTAFARPFAVSAPFWIVARVRDAINPITFAYDTSGSDRYSDMGGNGWLADWSLYTDSTESRDYSFRALTMTGPVGSGGNVTYTSAYASLPASPNAGDFWVPSDGYAIYRYSGTAWVPWGPVYPFTAPVDGDFTWINQGGASVSTTNGGIVLSAPTDSGTPQVRIRKKAAPATPYTITVALLPNWGTADNNFVCIGFRESSSGKLHLFEVDHVSGALRLVVAKWTDASTFSALYGSPTPAGWLAARPLWLRIGDNGTNRICSLSGDGQKFDPFHTVSSTDYMVANEVLFGVRAAGSTVYSTLPSWHEA
jgi:hypothetical protein